MSRTRNAFRSCYIHRFSKSKTEFSRRMFFNIHWNHRPSREPLIVENCRFNKAIFCKLFFQCLRLISRWEPDNICGLVLFYSKNRMISFTIFYRIGRIFSIFKYRNTIINCSHKIFQCLLSGLRAKSKFFK